MILNSAALFKDSWNTHWTCSGLSPSRPTASADTQQSHVNVEPFNALSKIRVIWTPKKKYKYSLNTSKGFVFGPLQHSHILYAVLWKPWHWSNSAHWESDLKRTQTKADSHFISAIRVMYNCMVTANPSFTVMNGIKQHMRVRLQYLWWVKLQCAVYTGCHSRQDDSCIPFKALCPSIYQRNDRAGIQNFIIIIREQGQLKRNHTNYS